MSDKKKQPPGRQSQSDFQLDDVDPFSVDEAMRERIEADRHLAAGRGGNRAMSFPKLGADGDSGSGSSASASGFRRAGPLKVEPPQTSAGGLLSSLRQQAQVLQQHDAQSARQRDALSVRMDHALRQVFAYLNELVQLLNQLKPPVPKEYHLGATDSLAGMSWHDGFCDYRSQTSDGGLLLESVGFSYNLASPKVLTAEREGGAIDSFRAALFEHALTFTSEEFRNDRFYVERAVFKIPVAVKVHVDWRADFEKGVIAVHGHNLGRFGISEYLIQPSAINDVLLEEFSNLVMGRRNRFPSLVRAQASKG